MGLIVRRQKEYLGIAEGSTGYLEEELKATQGTVNHESGLGKNKHRRILGRGGKGYQGPGVCKQVAAQYGGSAMPWA